MVQLKLAERKQVWPVRQEDPCRKNRDEKMKLEDRIPGSHQEEQIQCSCHLFLFIIASIVVYVSDERREDLVYVEDDDAIFTSNSGINMAFLLFPRFENASTLAEAPRQSDCFSRSSNEFHSIIRLALLVAVERSMVNK